MVPPDWKQYTPDDTPDRESSGGPGRPRPYQPPKPATKIRSLDERTVRRRGGPPVGLAVGGVVAVAGATALIFALAGGSDGDRPAGGEPQTDTGFAALVAALREETGGTVVRNVTIYPDYAVVDVPYRQDDPTDERELSYYWNGDLDEPSKGTGTEAVFDLTQVDAAVLDGLCQHAEALLEDAEECYLYISKPDPEDPTPGWITAGVRNDFNQSAYVDFDLAGNVLEEHPPS
ncbi:hypothetical protein RB608_20105 [Nocardioides sp. LHD-245]|uniref:hypothetical protein n=1 Tax=Nocardioides sp. LHD-245 TaxID=3051387 RepID=UPI0027E1F30A|nr:hypothetical protein [Nocardioides sp. LHD-245]